MAQGSGNVHILYATATGTAEDVAQGLAEALSTRKLIVRSYSAVDDYEIACLPADASAGHLFVFIVATCGDGEVPLNMRKFWHFIRRSDLPTGILTDLRFAVFGLGDRAYVKFNAAARKLYLRLGDLGASAIVPLSLGDESAQGGYDKELLPWIDRLCQAIAPGAGPENETKVPVVKEPRVIVQLSKSNEERDSEGAAQDMWRRGQARLTSPSQGGLLFEATVLRNEILTEPEFLTDNKEVRHIELDVSKASLSSGLREYVPGDIVHIMPRNRDSAVDAFFKLTGFDEFSMLDLEDSKSKTRFGSYQLNINLPCTFREFVSSQLDLSCTPRRSFFERLAPFASDRMQRERLMEFSSAEGAEILTQYAYREKRTILMVLRDFPSARPPLDHLIDMTPVLKSRPFSIASSKEAYPNEIHVCASIVQYTTPLRFSRVGVCSSFFLRLKVGDIVPVFLEKGISLRFNNSKPSIMIGPGTGVAPMRSFVSSVDPQGQKNVLFFGCRSRHGDFLYKQDWDTFLDSQKLWSIVTAFSREVKGKKIYVQDKLHEEGNMVWDMLSRQGACVYVAGSAGAMPKAVRKALVDIGTSAGKLTNVDAESFVRQMEANGRLQMECW